MTRQVVEERHNHPRRPLHCLHSRVDEEEEEVVDEGGGEEEDEDREDERAYYQLLHLQRERERERERGTRFSSSIVRGA